MMYKSSKGEVEIATMPFPYAKNALAKLLRDEPERAAEIEALEAHLAAFDQDGEPANPRVAIGDNNPPEEIPATGFDKFEQRAKGQEEARVAALPKGRAAIETHVADLLTEVQGCCLVIENGDQAGVVGRLHRQLQEAVALVDDAATVEKKPHNEALTEIGAWQNGFTAKGLKKTPDGSLTKALLATGNLSAAWLNKLDAERKAREEVVAEAARVAAREAISLHEEAKVTTDIEVMDRAEDALTEAKALLRQAENVSKERVSVGGGEGFKAVSLRSVWTAKATGEPGCWGLAYAHYKTNPEFMAEFHALIQRWADRDARVEATRVRGIPGFNIIEDKVV